MSKPRPLSSRPHTHIDPRQTRGFARSAENLHTVNKSMHDLITFCVSRRRRKMYCGHARLCVCLSVRGRTPTLLHGPGCNLGMVEAAP